MTPAPTTSGRVSRACLSLEVKLIPTVQVASRFSARRLMMSWATGAGIFG